MAVVSRLASPINIKGVSKSVSTAKKSLNQTTNSFKQISEILVKKTKVRRQIFDDTLETKRKRENYTIRKEEEDRLEAPNAVKSGDPSQVLPLIQSSGRSFFGRIISTLGYLAAGWVLRNLPTWVALGREFIVRVEKAGDIIKNFVSNTINVFTSTYQVLDGFRKNIMTFDLFDDSNRVKNSFDELKTSIDNMGIELENAIKLVTTPLTQTAADGTQVGTYSGENVPGLGTTSEDMGAYESTPSSSGKSGTKEQRALLDAISFAEGTTKGYGIIYGGANVPELSKGELTVRQVYDMMMSGKLNGRNVGYKSGSRATGRYQFMPDTLSDIVKTGAISWNEKFTPEAQDRAILARISSFRGVTPELLKKEGLSAKVSNMLAPEFASLPTYSGASFYGQPVKSLNSIQQKYKQSLGTTSQESSSPVKAISAGTMKLIPQTGDGGIIQGGSGSKGETHHATHFHIDAKTANPTAEQLANIREVSFQAVKAMLARGSTVWFGNIKQYASKNDSTLRNQIAAEQRAHDARSSAAVDIQETNPNVKRTFPSQAGSATKFPFSVGQVYSRGGYGREAEIIGSNGITVSHGAAGSSASQISPSTLVASPAKPSTPAPPPAAQISPAQTQQNQQQVAQQITPERRGQDVVAIIPQQQAARSPQSAAPASSAGGGSSAPSMFDVLNNFMKQKLLLDLAYL